MSAKVLVAPLNWGLGHASRCIPIIRDFLARGYEVVLGGDGDSLLLLRRHFPQLRYVELAPLQLHYSAGDRQVATLLKQLPKVVRWMRNDRKRLAQIQEQEHFTRVLSDNRPTIYIKGIDNIYVTHQLIVLSGMWTWLTTSVHRCLMKPYQQIWIPDNEEEKESLAGRLSHPKGIRDPRWKYIGPQSRFEGMGDEIQEVKKNSVVAVLSGLEPQRSLLEQRLIRRYHRKKLSVLIVQGLVDGPQRTRTQQNITMVNWLEDEDLVCQLKGAEHVIARSGYSTIMDFAALGILERAELLPTPGQTEQEYLGAILNYDRRTGP